MKFYPITCLDLPLLQSTSLVSLVSARNAETTFFLHLHFKCYPKSPLYPPLRPPSCSPTHSLPLLGPCLPLYWGIGSLLDQEASLPIDGQLGHLLLHIQLETRILRVLVSSYCSTYRVADPPSDPWVLSLAPPLGAPCSIL